MAKILTHSEFRKAQRRLLRKDKEVGRKYGFCYLCGNRLPNLNLVGRKKLVRDEHVVPKAVCGKLPVDEKSRWRLTAEVHKDCDEELKRNFDEFYECYQHTLGNESSDWDLRKAKHLRDNLGSLKILDNGETVGTIGGVDIVINAVWNWVRGFHALLHSSFLPPNSPRQIVPPMSSFMDSDARSIEEQNAELIGYRTTFATVCVLGKELGKANSVKCWGDQVRFYSVWTKINHPTRRGWKSKMSECYWVLTVPGLRPMAEKFSGEPIPWVGMYSMSQIPPNADTLSRQDFQTSEEFFENLDISKTINSLLYT